MIDWEKKFLPEICMAVHMHHTGACDDLTDSEHADAVAYIDGRVSTWNQHANGRRWATFDTQVLALCLATLAEARDWLAERAVIAGKFSPVAVAE